MKSESTNNDRQTVVSESGGSSALFQPLKLRGLTLPNRIVISPMCQYSASDGCATDWHLLHFGSMMTSGAGLFIIEATAVDPRGRITPECLGLWNDDNEDALRDVLLRVRRYSRVPVGIQLSHAGRKAASHRPFVGKGPLKSDQGAWPVIGPSAIPFADGWQVPHVMNRADMDEVVDVFVQAAKRADRLGVDLIELHAAHGYLLSAFLSPLANQRTDEYGGSREKRMRFPLEVFSAVRAVWPEHKPLGVRANGTDWHPQGLQTEDAVVFATELHKRGCDFVDLSTGGNAYTKVPIGPGYQVPFAEAVRQASGLATVAVGLIQSPSQAENIVASGQADLVAVGRAVLNNPHWPWQAAEELGCSVEVPWQYFRAATRAGVPPPYVR
jgi:2,4-dienoyl-CoA reductase-like NADH-dependent reductase (Old Yellow Enzyme family)